MSLYLWLKNLLDSEDGQDLIEYALIIALIVIVAIVGMNVVGQRIQAIWASIAASLQAAT